MRIRRALTVLIDGRSGAGKTTVAGELTGLMVEVRDTGRGGCDQP